MNDGNIRATPGCERAVREAVEILRLKGHSLEEWSPNGLTEAFSLMGRFMSSDGGRFVSSKLAHGPVDKETIGPRATMMKMPSWLKRNLAPIVSIWSRRFGGAFRAGQDSSESWQLWEMNARFLELAEGILRDWESRGFDAVIAPGFGMPAQPLGYPGWEFCANNYTGVYNLLNFPAGSVPVSLPQHTLIEPSSQANY